MNRILKVFLGKVRNGKLHLEESDKWLLNLKNFENKAVMVTIERIFRQRTIKQNKYYFGVIVEMLAEEFGYDHYECHQALKWEFDRVHTEGKPDTVKSTTTLTTMEMEERNERIRQWAMIKFNLYIPLPNEILLKEGSLISDQKMKAS